MRRLSPRGHILRLSTFAVGLGLSVVPPLPVAAQEVPTAIAVTVSSEQVSRFRPGSAESRFGDLEFLGGIEMSGSDKLFGAWSSIRLVEADTRFIGVLDTGHWLTGRIERDATGRLSGLADVAITPMIDTSGRFQQGKANMDAESLALRAGKVIVGFEQRHRIDVYPGEGFTQNRPERFLPLPFPARELRGNGGLETLAVAPAASPLSGSLVAIAERSVDADGNLFAGIIDGPLKGLFKVVRHDDFDVTDGAFLPDGDLLLLERRFSLATGVGMRVRRIAGADIGPGALVDGRVILEADLSDEIDNMEGLDVFSGADGSTHVLLVSDDNHSILQRNLMLEFKLVD